MIPIFWTEKNAIPNLHELLDSYRKHGGAIVQYDRVVSFLIFAQRTPVFEWVGPHTTRRAAGTKHALWSFVFGWWSFPGFFWTVCSIINNLMGGVDITRVLTTPPPLPGHPFDSAAIRELQAAQQRQQYIFLGVLLFLLMLVVVFLILPRL